MMHEHPKFRVCTDGFRVFSMDTFDGGSMKEIQPYESESAGIAVRIGNQVVRRLTRVIAECILGRELVGREEMVFINGKNGDFTPGNAYLMKRNYYGVPDRREGVRVPIVPPEEKGKKK